MYLGKVDISLCKHFDIFNFLCKVFHETNRNIEVQNGTGCNHNKSQIIAQNHMMLIKVVS